MGDRYETMAETAVSVDGVIFQRKEGFILGPLRFHVRRGEMLVVCGPNGGGKTTLLESLLGYHPQHPSSSGNISIGGNAKDGGRKGGRGDHAPSIGVFFPEMRPFQNLTIREQITFFSSLHGSRGCDMATALEKAGETPLAPVLDLPYKTLSSGKQTAFQLFLALFHSPDILFLDEPTLHLDATARDWFIGEIEKHIAAGGTVVASTHDSELVARASSLLFLKNGAQTMFVTVDNMDRFFQYPTYAEVRCDSPETARDIKAFLTREGFSVTGQPAAFTQSERAKPDIPTPTTPLLRVYSPHSMSETREILSIPGAETVLLRKTDLRDVVKKEMTKIERETGLPVSATPLNAPPDGTHMEKRGVGGGSR